MITLLIGVGCGLVYCIISIIIYAVITTLANREIIDKSFWNGEGFSLFFSYLWPIGITFLILTPFVLLCLKVLGILIKWIQSLTDKVIDMFLKKKGLI